MHWLWYLALGYLAFCAIGWFVVFRFCRDEDEEADRGWSEMWASNPIKMGIGLLVAVVFIGPLFPFILAHCAWSCWRASREWEKFGRTFRPVEFEALHQANLPPEAQQHFEQCAPILERLGFVPAVTCRLKPEPRPVLAHCLLSQDGATEASVAWIWGSPGLSFNSVLEDGRVLETACVEESLPQAEIDLINASAGYSTQMFAVGEGGIFADEDLLRSAYQSHLQRLAELEQRLGCGTLHLTADQIPDLKRYANAVFGQWQFDHGKVDNRPQPQPCPRGIARRIADLFEEQTRGQAGAENGAGLLVEHYA